MQRVPPSSLVLLAAVDMCNCLLHLVHAYFLGRFSACGRLQVGGHMML
jgi:hypothetical protein